MRKLLPLLIALSLLLSACGNGPAATAVETLAPTLAEPTPTLTPTPVPDKLLFANAGEAPKETVDRLLIIAQELAQKSGWTLESRLEIKPEELGSEVKAVLWVYPPESIGQIAAGAPGIYFAAVTPGTIAAAANLTVVQVRPENAAFLAGYMAVLAEIDWRAGGLFTDDPAGQKLGQAFQNGGRYWCGRCAPTVPPYYDQRYADAIALRFPTASFQPAGASLESWRPELDGLTANIISTLYISDSAFSPELLPGLENYAWLLGGGDSAG